MNNFPPKCMFQIFISCVFFFWDSASLWSSDWPGTAYVGQARSNSLSLLRAGIKGVYHHGHTKYLVLCLVCDRISLCSSDWPGILYVAEAGLELNNFPPPVSQVLRLQAHTNVAGFGFWDRVLLDNLACVWVHSIVWGVGWSNIQKFSCLNLLSVTIISTWFPHPVLCWHWNAITTGLYGEASVTVWVWNISQSHVFEHLDPSWQRCFRRLWDLVGGHPGKGLAR